MDGQRVTRGFPRRVRDPSATATASRAWLSLGYKFRSPTMSSDTERGSTFPVASIGLTRDVNRAAIFRMIGTDGPIARASMARRLNLSPATVTAVTRELLEQGLVRVAERAQARRGRPSMLLEVVGDAGRAFGVKVAPDHVVGVSVDLEAEI